MLADKAGVARKTVVLIEANESDKMNPRRLRVLAALQRVFEDEYGIELDGFDDNQIAVHLLALLRCDNVGAPPPDMLQPSRLRLSLRSKEQTVEIKP